MQVQASGEDEAVRNLTSGEYLPTPGCNPTPQTPNGLLAFREGEYDLPAPGCNPKPQTQRQLQFSI